ncbi:hypothetical protein [Streptomyces arenae]|uniref:hypothetical protein n=1 Tax=Streptomyces arenae TaxID=29301 RepID=UPI00265967B0|nr:hypothetical protein [Streptomyces arenae]MCG7208161.1 hypothetical protein [Streptomyces arenae]
MEGWNFWWGIAAFFLGGLATQLNGWLAYRRQRKDRADDAADALRARQEEFELQHLVAFNQLVRNAVDKLYDYNGAVRWDVTSQGAASRGSGTAQRREEAGQAFEIELSKVTAELGFILADDIRGAAATLVGYMAERAGLLHTSAQIHLVELAHQADTVYLPIGERVRSIYAGRASVALAAAGSRHPAPPTRSRPFPSDHRIVG